jgi:hypothetical protein
MSIVDSLGNAIGVTGSVAGLTGAVGNLFQGSPSIKLPLPNPLAAYASYTYVITISCIPDEALNFPDKTYMKGKVYDIIAKTANMDPKNRVKTAYGKFDFFIDNLEITNTIGQRHGRNNMVSTISFDILEPYSMGLFLQSVQAAADKYKHPAYTEAPFLLTIEFKGIKENGQMSSVPNATRYIPFRFADINFNVSSQGSTYRCTAYNWAAQAAKSNYSQLKNDHSISGKTVQEILQTGPNSLQTVVNKRFQDLVKQNVIAVADEIVILFPKSEKVATGEVPKNSTTENKATATTTPAANTDTAIEALIGASRSDVTKLLVQKASDVNELGAAPLAFSEVFKGDSASKNEGKVYNAVTKTWDQSQVTIDPKEGSFKFKQDTDVFNAITQIIIGSGYVDSAFSEKALDDKGQRRWFNIDMQVFNKSTTDNMTSTGQKPKLIVYRVVPYTVNVSSAPMATNTAPPDVKNLSNEVCKVYNYIYTGKNTEVLRFEIQFSTAFAQYMAADNSRRSKDVVTASQTGESKPPTKPLDEKNIDKGNKPDTKSTPSYLNWTKTFFKTDFLGGGPENESTRAARSFHEAITRGLEQMELNMDIVGDPYFLVQSGLGNYTSAPTKKQNLNKDQTVNWQNGQVDILVNFRTPIDINQTTGLYNFGPGTKTAPVTKFSGYYWVVEVKNMFKGGMFTQTLIGMRRPNQENTKKATTAQTANTSNKAEPENSGKGGK